MGMSIFEAIAIFLIGCLVGYLICMTSWVKELCREENDIQMVLAKLKAEIEPQESEET